MKTNSFTLLMLAIYLLVGGCKKEDDSSIQLADTTWCATYSDENHDYEYQLAFLQNQRLKTLMHGKIRRNASDPGAPVELGGQGEYQYQVSKQLIDATDVSIFISNSEAGIRDTLVHYAATINDGPARITGKHYKVSIPIGNTAPVIQSAAITYYAGGCRFQRPDFITF